MSLIKNDSWSSGTEDAIGDTGTFQFETASTNRVSRSLVRLYTRVVGLLPRSTRLRLLIGPIIGPFVACVILVGIGDLRAPGWMITIFGIATLTGLLVTGAIIRQALKPLNDIADAANRLGIVGSVERLPEYGSSEASVAARAFNAMSERVNKQVEERIRLLSAFSHDMQTPITRMRLRVELAENFPEREKLLKDLREAEKLVRDGIAYARNSHITHENEAVVDLRAFIESIVFDYQDTGRDVSISGMVKGIRTVKPGALRRILSNFIDNALKFAGRAEVSVSQNDQGETMIAVLDRGPGISPDKFEAVMRPFVRLNQLADEQAPGVGLGLAIAQQLAREMGASLVLQNREGGGLSAQIVFASAEISTRRFV